MSCLQKPYQAIKKTSLLTTSSESGNRIACGNFSCWFSASSSWPLRLPSSRGSTDKLCLLFSTRVCGISFRGTNSNSPRRHCVWGGIRHSDGSESVRSEWLVWLLFRCHDGHGRKWSAERVPLQSLIGTRFRGAQLSLAGVELRGMAISHYPFAAIGGNGNGHGNRNANLCMFA